MEEWSFGSASKVEPLTHRVAPPSLTLAQVRACARRVPITRVSDLSPLDRLQLPVYSATTPLARDLTTHLGKGLDAERAQLSAMMEAVERVSGESCDRPVRHLAFQDLSQIATVADPRAFDLPEDSTFRPDHPIAWVEGYDLLGNEPVWLPLDLVVSPPREGVLRSVDSNGLASGNTLLEAAVHGLCEVIERDAMGLHLFCALFADAGEQVLAPRRLDPASLPPACQAWTGRIGAHGLRIEIDALESEVRIPVFRAVLVDDGYPSPRGDRARTFVGFGASPNAEVAAMRSISEAVQSRLAIVQGARDSFNAVTVRAHSVRAGAGRGPRELDGRLGMPFTMVPSFTTTDLREDLHHILQRLTEAGFKRAIAVNLTRPDLGIAVVRIRVPGLTSFAVNRTRVGWRCLRYLL